MLVSCCVQDVGRLWKSRQCKKLLAGICCALRDNFTPLVKKKKKFLRRLGNYAMLEGTSKNKQTNKQKQNKKTKQKF